MGRADKAFRGEDIPSESYLSSNDNSFGAETHFGKRVGLSAELVFEANLQIIGTSCHSEPK